MLTALFVSLMFLVGSVILGSGESAKIQRIKHLIETEYFDEYDEELLEEGAYYGIPLMLGDPYSSYLSSDDVEALEESITGEYVGIGVEITIDPDDGMITVISPISGSPADQAGIRTGDKFLSINGEEVTGSTLDEVVSMLKNGKKKEKIKLELLRDGETISLTVIRDEIVVHSATGSMLDNGIGYIKLSSFDDTTVNEFSDVLSQLEQDGATSLILDLRGNPGGTVEAAQFVADLFLEEGTFYYTLDKYGEKEYFETDEGMNELPLVVLINKGSASASEMLAGALQDRERATLVGVTTFGKGIMQQHFMVDSSSMLKLTTHEFYTPNGNRIHETGISPDVEVSMDSDITLGDTEQDIQLQEAISLLTE
ncbi:MAG: S41 family peptidase [Ruminococcaceae bacterium]|nr:S41 family peptidase [Oscillospiraceae bacterium]